MFLGIQKKYSEYFCSQIAGQNLQLDQICLGDYQHFTAESCHLFEIKVLILDEKVDFQDLVRIKPQFVFNETDFLSSQAAINEIVSFLQKKNKILEVKKSTEYKKKELENLNLFLSDESNEKKNIMTTFKKQELDRKSVEKKLLYFFDFITTESQRSDFPTEIMNLLALELRKIKLFYKIGFLLKGKSSPAFAFETNGHDEKSKVLEINQEIDSNQLTHVLANLWQRPIGKLFVWNVVGVNSHFVFYVENQNYDSKFEDYDTFLKDRLTMLAISIQQWFLETIERKIYNQWHQIFKTYNDPMHVIDDSFNLIHSNYESKEAQKLKCYEVLANINAPCENCPVLSLKQGSQVHIKDQTFESIHTNFLVDEEKYHFISYQNLTEMNLLKSNFIQNEKMSALGKLANHLMHELNNPLTGLKMYCELLMTEEQTVSPHLKSDLEEVLKAVVRCQAIISDLSRFVHDQPLVLEKVNLKIVIEKTLVFLKSLVRTHKLFVDVKSIEVLGHFTYIQQIIFNLVKNSCQAMKDGGALKIYLNESEQFVELFFDDEGPGLTQAIQSTLFKPFTTSKNFDQGTGLGLYLSQKLIHQMNAELIYDSSYLKGTRFVMRFKK